MGTAESAVSIVDAVIQQVAEVIDSAHSLKMAQGRSPFDSHSEWNPEGVNDIQIF